MAQLGALCISNLCATKPILAVIKAIQNNDLHKIEDIDLIKTVKWKIAFLYQDRNNLKIIPTFAEQRLRYLTGVGLKDKDFTIEKAYQQLISEKGDQDLFDFNSALTQKYLEANPKDKFNTQIAYDYMHERYPEFEKNTEYLFVIENKYNYELALETTNFDKSSPRLFLKCIPPKYIKGLQVNSILKGKSPNSNLESTKTLTRNDEFVQVIVTNMQQLEAFCNWWDELNESNQDSSEASKLEVSQMEEIAQPLNRILFGAAGTGKTYHTINHALSIIKNSSLEKILIEERKLGRKVLKKQFDEYREQGRIEFVTFHQSFSYEDFVEGIRAESKKNEKNEYIVHYPIISGIFKRICENIKKEKERIDFGDDYVSDESIQKALNELIEKVKKQETSFFTKTGYEFILRLNQNGKLAARAVSGKGSTTSLSHPAIARYLKDQSDEIIANKSYEWAIAKELRQEVKKEKYKSDYIQEPYILIIDEINRGNISRIFGELITLIEESKRTGAEEELSVTLPYSKQEFTVPSNLYIIGTMNSSDRSLTGLDVALRRRFTFIEMPPRPDLLKDKNGQPIQINAVNQEGVNMSVNISELLTVINQRIEVLLDRDHCIGHANFMSLNSQSTVEELAQIFKQKIIPQLQEYFFDDWSKINMVLNRNGMLEATSLERSKIFPNVNTEEIGFFDEQKIWNLVESEFDNIQSFAKIIKH
ncbi:McrB family protein [Acinetobacter nosocomialis]|uniref:McrB family protein n=1 Tax=Acinetobacter nosocomialis TaxID=106654 RepID=UPI003AF97541